MSGSFAWVRHLRVLLVALATTLAFASPVLAQWPTACVDLNDIVEAHLGNQGNVGIYQRTFDAGAEAACQADHRDDVRTVFAWAFSSKSTGAIAPTAWPSSCVELNDIVEAHIAKTGSTSRFTSELLASVPLPKPPANLTTAKMSETFLPGPSIGNSLPVFGSPSTPVNATPVAFELTALSPAGGATPTAMEPTTVSPAHPRAASPPSARVVGTAVACALMAPSPAGGRMSSGNRRPPQVRFSP